MQTRTGIVNLLIERSLIAVIRTSTVEQVLPICEALVCGIEMPPGEAR